jgi:hypothetical protein
MSSHDALATRIARIEMDAAISLESIDLTIVKPARLRAEFSEVFEYFAAVEGDVAQTAVDVAAMLPRFSPCERRFLQLWSAQEVAHSAVFDALRAELGLESVVSASPTSASPFFRSIGALVECDGSGWLYAVLKLVYLARGAMHEHLTCDAYRRLGNRFGELGEVALARTITDPIRRQEAVHLGYYRLAARLQRDQMSATQVAWARTISAWSYAPVGASRRHRRPTCGRVFERVAGDGMEDALAPVQAIAEGLLGNGSNPLPPFVSRAMNRCLARSGGERRLAPITVAAAPGITA